MLEAEASPASEDADGSFKTGGVDAGTGTSVGVGSGVDDVDKVSPMSDSPNGTTISFCAVSSRE